MKAILQRVTKAKVEVDSKTVGEIGTGFLILLGVENGDTEKEADALTLWLPQDLTQPIRSTNISAKKCTITELSVLKREFSVPI